MPSSPKAAGAEDEGPISDEEIEAQYFPGTVPMFPDPGVELLKGLAFKGNEWESVNGNSIVVVLSGTPDGPNSAALERARYTLSRYAEVEAIAKQVARDFCRQEGSWFVSELNFGRDATSQSADLCLRLHLSPIDGSGAHEYTEYLVCFTFDQVSEPRRWLRVNRVVVQFV